jgi:hypothetical protein
MNEDLIISQIISRSQNFSQNLERVRIAQWVVGLITFLPSDNKTPELISQVNSLLGDIEQYQLDLLRTETGKGTV